MRNCRFMVQWGGYTQNLMVFSQMGLFIDTTWCVVITTNYCIQKVFKLLFVPKIFDNICQYSCQKFVFVQNVKKIRQNKIRDFNPNKNNKTIKNEKNIKIYFFYFFCDHKKQAIALCPSMLIK